MTMQDPSNSGSGTRSGSFSSSSSSSSAPSGGTARDQDSCRVCGGDGRIDNAFGQVARCPSCHGNGRRSEDTGFHDVTKTKASHHQRSNKAAVVVKQTWPTTMDGIKLATEIRDAANIAVDTKERLTREIIDHESTHGQCTQTFLKKVRKQFKPSAAR
jgi:hypothetical protein